MEGYNVKFFGDDDAKVWIAICEEIPLAMEDDSLDKLLYRVKIVASELNNLPKYESLFINLTQREKMIYS